MSRGVDREPCPYRIIDDAGNAFVFGIVGGGIWHFVGGARNAPQRTIQRMITHGAKRAMSRAPILGGSFAVWGLVFSCCDCTLTYVRKKEDHYNAIAAGAVTGGILALRGGIKSAGKNALIGGFILALIEGFSIGLQRVIVPMFEKKAMEAGEQIDLLEPPVDVLMKNRNSTSRRDIYTPPPMPATGSLSSTTGGGFDLDSIKPFDTHDSDLHEVDDAAKQIKEESKPFWKVW